MAGTKISSSDTTDFSSTQYNTTAPYQDPTLYPSSYRPEAAGETSQSEYQNTKWGLQFGAYMEVSELGGMIDRKAMFTVGKGFKADTTTTKMLRNIHGNGLDTFNIIMYNAVRTYTTGGDFYAEIIKTKRGKLTNLKPLNPSTVKVHANKFGIIKKYEVFPVQTAAEKKPASIMFKPSEMFHLAYNRMADQIHGQSVVDKLEEVIEMRRESMKDMRVVFHRYVKPLWVFSVDTDDSAEITAFKNKVDTTIQKAENLVVPKDTVSSIERISIPQYSTLDPLPWLKALQREFLKAEGVPALVMGVGADSTEAESKILYLGWQQVVEFNQMFLEEQIKAQLGLEVEFEFPASIAPELISDEKKDSPQTKHEVEPGKDSK